MSEGDQGHNWMPDWFWDSIEDEPETPEEVRLQDRAKAKMMNFATLYGADPNRPLGVVTNWQPSPTGRLPTGIPTLDLTFGGGVKLNIIKAREPALTTIHFDFSKAEQAVMNALKNKDIIVFDSVTPSPEGRSVDELTDRHPRQ